MRGTLRDRDFARFVVSAAPGLGPASLSRLLSAFGNHEAILEAPFPELEARAGIRSDLAREIRRAAERPEEAWEILEALDSCGAHVLYPDSPELPRPLRSSRDSWHFLTMLGEPRALDTFPVIGMVGCRRATPEGLQFAHDLAAELGRRGVATLSGMAQGIDRASHLGSLSEGAQTIGALPLGLLRFLHEERRWLHGLEGRREENLALVSGAPPRQLWSVSEAMRRNGWIAAWCDALVVVEAGDKGGTWKTASSAVRLGKPLWVVTGFDSAEAGVGNSGLLKTLRGQALSHSEPIDSLAERIQSSIVPGESP
ncbi:MAG: hypothetical protein GHCLOJNM_01196 [bacterium]|nr:hypothetical protein [bacterium]